MKITKEGDELVVRIPFEQTGDYTYGEGQYKVSSLVGVIAGQEYTISHLVYLDYKDDYQEGAPIIYLDSKEELEEVCKEFNIEIIEHAVCEKCGKVIYGSCTMSENGFLCYECYSEQELKL